MLCLVYIKFRTQCNHKFFCRKPTGGFRAGGRGDHERDQGWRGREDYRGRDNYGGGRDDRSRSGSYDRNRRDPPTNRNPRDHKVN